METKSLIKHLSVFYPKRIALKYNDYSGIQLGKLKKNTNSILLCLDFDHFVYDYIVNNHLINKLDLIITHHPFIYGKKRDILKNDHNKNDLYQKMIEKNIPIYSYHTNFDEGKYGMNDALANKLELTNIKPLYGDPMARGGELKKPMEIFLFAKTCKKSLDVDYGLLINEGKKMIKTVAIVGGGGWRSFKIAKDEGYDIFISGDMPHHARREVIENKYNYLDLPHEIEKIFMPQMKEILLKFDNTLNIYTIDHEKLPIVI